MRFAVDAHTIGAHLTGNEVYIRNLLNEFARIDASDDLIAYVSKQEAPAQLPTRVLSSWVSANPYRRLGFDLPRRLRVDRPDLLHVQYTGPLFSSTPLVVSVHDVSYLEHPKYFTRFRSRQLQITVRRTLQKAAAVLTPSEFSKRAILQHYDIDASKVHVIPNAVSGEFRLIDRQVAAVHLRQRFQLEGPFVLMVGDLQPRKNHLGLLRAFEEVLRANPGLPHKLVFVGKETWYSPELHRLVNQSALRDRVYYTGFVEDTDLPYFYGACDLFVYPSFYEGFGLPILEAMACGRAVACSNTTAMPEVANAAGILFDPHSKSEIVRAITDVLLDSELRQRLERLGAKRAGLFSWERAAAQTLDVYRSVAGHARLAEVTQKAHA